MLRDLCAHHAWADAEHWRAFETYPLALEDAVLFGRLHHLHLTQSAFVWAFSDRRSDFVFSAPDDFTPRTLKAFAMDLHEGLARAAMVAEPALDRRISIPWFTNPPLELSVREALTQVAMHSHYHRGQNATRLRELGGEPPMTDLIAWYWKGRPAAVWSG